MIETDVVIIGGGLSGLALHHYLQKQGISARTIEARERLGGRILTEYIDGHAPIELGATWLGEQHTYFRALLKELDIKTFTQILGDKAIYEPISTSPHQLVRLPPNDTPSYRVAGGTSTVIDALQKKIPADHIILGQAVAKITQSQNAILVEGENIKLKAKIVVSTLPPNLFKAHVHVEPTLPDALIAVMSSTHTWMSTSIKIGLKYPEVFWRTDHLSGTMFSNVGPISELYDHSDCTDRHYALKGFLNNVYHTVSSAKRKQIVIKQLSKYYGPLIEQNLSYVDKDWSKEIYTHTTYASHVLPHQYNGHQLYQKGYLDNRLFFGGTETAKRNPGYMEGAVYRSVGLAEEISSRL